MTNATSTVTGQATILQRGTPEYLETLHGVFNPQDVKRSPVEIHVVESTEQVAAALKRAQELGVPVGVRGGGHHPHKPSLIQDGILIDTARLNHELNYDPETHEVNFGPSIRVEEAWKATSALGRFFPHGHAPSVGLGGFLLAGGQGFFMPGWGVTITKWITKLEIVVPDGRVLIATKDENPDLFWAARGAGFAFFGVVTRFWSRTIPAKKLYGRNYSFEVKDNFEDLISFGFDRNDAMPKSFTETAICTLYPELLEPNSTEDSIPESSKLQLWINVSAYADSLAEATKLLEVWDGVPENLRPSLTKTNPVSEISFEDYFVFQHSVNPQNPNQKWSIHSILNDPKVPRAKLLEAIKPLMLELPTRSSYGCLYISDLLDVDENDAVFSLPQQYYISAFVGWKDDSIASKVREAMIGPHQKAETVAIGQYIADYNPNSDATHTPKLRPWTDTARDKFLKIREKYDPHSLFIGYKALVPQ